LIVTGAGVKKQTINKGTRYWASRKLREKFTKNDIINVNILMPHQKLRKCLTQSRRQEGGFGACRPHNKAPRSPKLNYEALYIGVVFIKF